jgi:hypothetical protein
MRWVRVSCKGSQMIISNVDRTQTISGQLIFLLGNASSRRIKAEKSYTTDILLSQPSNFFELKKHGKARPDEKVQNILYR